jgi:hypothetical protein
MRIHFTAITLSYLLSLIYIDLSQLPETPQRHLPQEATQRSQLIRSAPVNRSSAARLAGTAPVVADAARGVAARIHCYIHAFPFDSEQGIRFVLGAARLCFYVTLWKLGDEHCSSGRSSPCGPYLRVATIWTWPRHAVDMLVPQDSFVRNSPLLVTVRHSLKNVSAKLEFRMRLRDEAFLLGWRRRLPSHLRTSHSLARALSPPHHLPTTHTHTRTLTLSPFHLPTSLSVSLSLSLSLSLLRSCTLSHTHTLAHTDAGGG